MKSFVTLASKLILYENSPYCTFDPPGTKGGGNSILPIWHKNLIISPKIFVESFITLASKLTILKINPIALLTPP